MQKYTKLGKYCAPFTEVANEIASYIFGIDTTAYSLAVKAAGWADGRYVYLASTSPNLIGLITRVGRAQRRLNQTVSSFRNQLGIS